MGGVDCGVAPLLSMASCCVPDCDITSPAAACLHIGQRQRVPQTSSKEQYACIMCCYVKKIHEVASNESNTLFASDKKQQMADKRFM